MLKTKLNKISKNTSLLFLLSITLFAFACQPPSDSERETPFGEKSANITPTPKQNLNEFESELKSLRIADFYHIYTLKRKDANEFNSDDKKFVRENIHYSTNRTSFIKEDKILFIGTNYKPTDEQIEALKNRFEFQDFSKPDEQIKREKAEKKAEREKLKKEMEEANTSRTNKKESVNK